MFDNPAEVDSITYQMRLADWTRSQNRAMINALFNGVPPYTNQQVDENNLSVNVNFLEGMGIAHDARAQFAQAYQKPGNYFTLKTDYGPIHKRDDYARLATKEMNRIMKRSLPFFEVLRGKFASNILHGIGPSIMRNQERWCPKVVGVEDVFIPANVTLTMEDLPLFAIYRTFTGPELYRLAKSPKPDPAWNQNIVDALIEWIDETTPSLFSTNWPELWSPEKAQERVKGDGNLYSGDAVPVVNVWDFYFLNEDGKHCGWNRRMLVDAWASPDAPQTPLKRKKGKVHEMASREFLFNSKDRVVASELSQLINFQFADLSAVAPFRYHTVRSLGFFLYSICHLQNRLRCRINESVMEQMMQLFRVTNADDMQRTLKAEFINKGVVDDAIKFLPATERWTVDMKTAQFGLSENAQLIARNSSSYLVNPMQQTDKREKTKFEVMSEVNAMTSLVSTGLQQSYIYQTFEYNEILRRFCRRNSEDPEVRRYQANCLRQGVPEKILYNPDCWELDPERVVGAGNKTLELAIAQQLMEYRGAFDPQSQRQILRDVTTALTDDPAKADLLVPPQPQISDSIHDAQLASASLMMGLPVAAKSGINHIDYIEALMANMAITIKQITQSGNVGTPEKVIGLKNMANHITQHLNMLAQDKTQIQRVKQYGDQLTQLMNLVKGFEQRLMQQQKQAGMANGNGAMEAQAELAKTQAKIKALEMETQAKAANTRESHAQRTAQRQLQFEMEMRQKQQQAEMDLREQQARFAVDAHTTSATKAMELEQERQYAAQERAHTQAEHEQYIQQTEAEAKAEAKKAKAKKSGQKK